MERCCLLRFLWRWVCWRPCRAPCRSGGGRSPSCKDLVVRRRVFALMKGLGGSQGQLMGMFLLEALVLALAGVAVGFVVGSAAAWAISEVNFHTASPPRLQVVRRG